MTFNNTHTQTFRPGVGTVDIGHAHTDKSKQHEGLSGGATAHATHAQTYIGARERIAPPRAAWHALQRQRDAKATQLHAPPQGGLLHMADAAAFGAPCWTPLAAPGGKHSSCMRRKRPAHMASPLPAHTGRGYASGVSGEATQGM